MATQSERIAEDQALIMLNIEERTYKHPRPTDIVLHGRRNYSPLDILREVRRGTDFGKRYLASQTPELIRRAIEHDQTAWQPQKLRMLRIVAWEFWNIPGELAHGVRKTLKDLGKHLN